jgi:hypothetical protein
MGQQRQWHQQQWSPIVAYDSAATVNVARKKMTALAVCGCAMLLRVGGCAGAGGNPNTLPLLSCHDHHAAPPAAAAELLKKLQKYALLQSGMVWMQQCAARCSWSNPHTCTADRLVQNCCRSVPCPHVAHIGPVIAKQLQLRVFLQIKASRSRSKRGRELIGDLCVRVCVWVVPSRFSAAVPDAVSACLIGVPGDH